jgi:hypothetical protein
VFDAYGIDRLAKWKEFRQQLEHSQTPLEDVVGFWSRAPFVSSYLNPKTPQNWPDPWHLILDQKLDSLAIVLGMLYTIKLTQRFMDAVCEIHMSMPQKEKDHDYYLVIDDAYVLNFYYGAVAPIADLKNVQTNILFSVKTLQ